MQNPFNTPFTYIALLFISACILMIVSDLVTDSKMSGLATMLGVVIIIFILVAKFFFWGVFQHWNKSFLTFMVFELVAFFVAILALCFGVPYLLGR